MTAERRGSPDLSSMFGVGGNKPPAAKPPAAKRAAAAAKAPAAKAPARPPVDPPAKPAAAKGPKPSPTPEREKPAPKAKRPGRAAAPAAKQRISVNLPPAIAARLDHAANNPADPKWRNEILVEALERSSSSVTPPEAKSRRRGRGSTRPTNVQFYVTAGERDALEGFAQRLAGGVTLSAAVTALLDAHLPK